MECNYKGKIIHRKISCIQICDNYDNSKEEQIAIQPLDQDEMNQIIRYLIQVPHDISCIQMNTIKDIFNRMDINQLISYGIVVQNVIKTLMDIFLYDKKNIFKLIKIIEILNDKGFKLIDWVYPYFYNIGLNQYNMEKKSILLRFFTKHNLITYANIKDFVSISNTFDIILIEYYFRKTNLMEESNSIKIFLESLLQQENTDNSFNWNCYVIKFLVNCIYEGFNLHEFEDRILRLLETLNEYEADDPMIFDLISIVLAHLSGIQLNKHLFKLK